MPATEVITKALQKILDDANIPALSMAWHQKNRDVKIAVGVTDNSNPKPVDTTTLFKASSLSKPVSAAIVLDLLEKNNLKLDTKLADLADYGPPELKNDPYYRELTIGMIIGQCSGLPNWFYEGMEKKFIAKPGTEINYSGIALDFLKEVIEKKLEESWEQIAQEFFVKVGMHNSTYKELPASYLQDKRNVTRGHQSDGTPDPAIMNVDSLEIPAASLLTTAEDFMIFLQYCYNNNFLKSTLLTGVYNLNKKELSKFAEDHIQWSFGMGVYTNDKKTIAFHWGNNKNWNSFCAIDTTTGDAIVCFVNSANGPDIFQQLVKPVVGDLTPLFQWLSQYLFFKAEKPLNTSQSITMLYPLMNALTEKNETLFVHTSSIFSEAKKTPMQREKDATQIEVLRKKGG